MLPYIQSPLSSIEMHSRSLHPPIIWFAIPKVSTAAVLAKKFEGLKSDIQEVDVFGLRWAIGFSNLTITTLATVLIPPYPITQMYYTEGTSSNGCNLIVSHPGIFQPVVSMCSINRFQNAMGRHLPLQLSYWSKHITNEAATIR